MKRSIIIFLYKIAFQLNLLRRKLLRPLTLGVKIMLVREGQVLLVRHTYRSGWFMPGGGVKRGETLEEAARREAREEVGAIIEDIALFGIYSQISPNNNDHIAVFITTAFTLSGKQDYEIAESAFFPITNPPANADLGCRLRLQEYGQNLPINQIRIW